jgi:saccharopine dehydrogenase (NAD+, L-lysine forming)
MKAGKILIAGGYGAVGRIIAEVLANIFPGQVTVAGRDGRKAEALAAATGHKVLPMALDVGNLVSKTAALRHPLDGIAVVVMCVDQPDTRFVELCLQKGIDYVDITARHDFLVQVEQLQPLVVTNSCTAVLSVGLTPGLTNLLARHAQSQFEELHRLDIHVLLGLGEAHGEAAVRWVVENIHTTFDVLEGGKLKRVRSFEDGKQALFPGELGKRTTYRFNIADQHVLARTLQMEWPTCHGKYVDSVSTRLGFDSVFVTRLLATLKRSGALAILRYQWVQDRLVALFKRLHFGSDQFVVQVDARGLVDGRLCAGTYAVAGHGQARMTGLVAAQVVQQLMAAEFPPGVFHIEQLFEPLAFIDPLQSAGLHTSSLSFRYV